MITVLHVITGLEIGGAEKFLVRLVSFDAKRIRHIVFSLTGRGALTESIEALGIPVYAPKSAGFAGKLSLVPTLRQIARREDVQVVQSWMYKADLAATVAFFASGIPVIWNVRQTNIRLGYNSWSNIVCMRLLQLLSWFATPRIVYCANAARRNHEATGYRRSVGQVIANGIDTQSFKPSANQPKAGFQVVNVARYDVQKGQLDFIACARHIIARIPQAGFTMVGRGVDSSNRVLQQAIKSSGLEQHISLLGERQDVADVLSESDLYLSCSTGEGLPNAVAEAMSMGLPVVATDVGDTRDVVGPCGVVCPVGDIQAIVDAVSDILGRDSVSRDELGRSARRRIVECFGIESSVDAYAKLYLEVAGSAG